MVCGLYVLLKFELIEMRQALRSSSDFRCATRHPAVSAVANATFRSAQVYCEANSREGRSVADACNAARRPEL